MVGNDRLGGTLRYSKKNNEYHQNTGNGDNGKFVFFESLTVFAGETGSFGGGGDGEYTGGDGGETGGGDACGRYGEAVCCAGSCRGDPQFSQNDWPGSAFVPHMGQKGIPINIPCTINRKKRFYIYL